MDGSLREAYHRFWITGGTGRQGTAEERRERRCPVQELAVAVAVSYGKKSLVLDRPEKKAVYLGPVPFITDEFGQWFLKCCRDKSGPDVQVPDEPTKGELVDEGYSRICQESYHCNEGKDKTEGETKGPEYSSRVAEWVHRSLSVGCIPAFAQTDGRVDESYHAVRLNEVSPVFAGGR